ncbi:MAG: xanthine dehydrogenase family protein subunit M [Chloroflexi bacterium]|nr:xanthine dehydrogenase family protein subunit M [Chloroflexota bacterium]MDA1270806.1 xanthine dehydrogenase family protein subunit M [Chloroflexota bacterium]
MKRFEYLEPRTLRQAISMLQRHGENARIVAGSTDFLVRWRAGFWNPEQVINIQRVAGLGRITFSARNGLRIGALVTIRTLEQDTVVRRRYPALAAAAASFAGVQVRNLATAGGNICNASPSGDIIPALLVFGGECRIAGPDGERLVALDQFFTGPGRTVLQTGEILAEVRVPPTPANTGSHYIKHSPRGAMDIATVGAAALITLDDKTGACSDAKIALGAVAPTPVRAYAAEDILRGQQVTPQIIQAAAAAAEAGVKPIDDIRGSAAHRKEMVGVLTRRTLEQALRAAVNGPLTFEEQRRLTVQATF